MAAAAARAAKATRDFTVLILTRTFPVVGKAYVRGVACTEKWRVRHIVLHRSRCDICGTASYPNHDEIGAERPPGGPRPGTCTLVCVPWGFSPERRGHARV